MKKYTPGDDTDQSWRLRPGLSDFEKSLTFDPLRGLGSYKGPKYDDKWPIFTQSPKREEPWPRAAGTVPNR